ncbi:MAG TPA: type II toxin-antitoxin system VapC family toxin [Thermomicrobiales bacterium]|nr:type II toxin-antitoxin system VapC family toxin [Thermomicrobiales bacterium]
MRRYLLDTVAVSELEKENPNERVIRYLLTLPNSRTFISAITIGEIQRGITRLPSSKRRLKLESFLERVIEDFSASILPIDTEVGLRWGQLYARCQARGVNLASSDSLIAATALHHGMHIVTRNAKDFEPTGVLIINPWDEVES